MKKLVTSAILATACTVSFAQNLYIKAGAGYSYPLAGQTINLGNNEVYNGNVTVSEITGEISKYDVKPASIAAGIQGHFGLGLELNEHVALELNASIGLRQTKTKSTTSYPYVEKSTLLSVNESYSMFAQTPILINPSVKIQSGGRPKIYARAGVLLPAKTSITGTFSGNISDPAHLPFKYSGTHEYKTKFGIGFNGALGMQANTAIEWLKVWAEANFNSMSLYVTERNTTEYYIDGGNALHLLSPKSKTKTYGTKSSTGDSTPTWTIPFSSFGAAVGISFIL